MPSAGLILVGRIRKAHGIRGELVIEPLTDTPDMLFTSGRRFFAGDTEGDPSPGDQQLTVLQARFHKEGVLVQMEGISDRTAAERWRGRYLLAPADELSPPESDQVYVHELPGMRVELGDGVHLGQVANVYELPQGILLEVERSSGASVLVPFRAEFVQSVDRAGRVLVITPPEGLLDV